MPLGKSSRFELDNDERHFTPLVAAGTEGWRGGSLTDRRYDYLLLSDPCAMT
jgi:hypothetical protein